MKSPLLGFLKGFPMEFVALLGNRTSTGRLSVRPESTSSGGFEKLSRFGIKSFGSPSTDEMKDKNDQLGEG